MNINESDNEDMLFENCEKFTPLPKVSESDHQPNTPKKIKCSRHEKDQAVSKVVDLKVSVSVVADKYGVSSSTVRKWVQKAGKVLPSRQKAGYIFDKNRQKASPKKPSQTMLDFFQKLKVWTQMISLK